MSEKDAVLIELLISENKRLKSENELLLQDKNRLDWLIDHNAFVKRHEYGWVVGIWNYGTVHSYTYNDARRALDDRMEKEK